MVDLDGDRYPMIDDQYSMIDVNEPPAGLGLD